jgi:hypothetical protein
MTLGRETIRELSKSQSTINPFHDGDVTDCENPFYRFTLLC